ncbi:ORF 42 [Macacine gammaherpesvirus 5]|uniref:ORF42 n=1 Tax=Rhesus monkey rhadinovirus H26-95 TaxID=69256 RepID=Q9J2K3_9GAMA|nr:ORF42 [Rhesus monkey rhadinovirus H26-95]QFN51643.1 ORF 42 [Macacine gammaherpesvirus 5]QFN51739.1 ORF 42 [Macacine gammaherpesvirus 5]QFN51830.1 ORF 42 [Macacine gammaherpesvirus 5]QFQ66812.1 ORF 42 [Macacine gammaherpesvirus 5]
MDQILKRLMGEQHRSEAVMPETECSSRGPYNYPVLPRLMLEVHKKNSICMASNTPKLCVRGRLNVPDLGVHVRTRLQSATFTGFVFACVVEHEDMIDALDIYPHVFSDRVQLFKPASASVTELCCILSMLENYDKPPLSFILSALDRARYLHERYTCNDSAFVLYGIEVIASTLAAYHELNPPQGILRVPPLVRFKLHKLLDENADDMKGLLKPIYLESFRLTENVGEEEGHAETFNIFYCGTIFTRHLHNASVLKYFQITSLHSIPRQTLF